MRILFVAMPDSVHTASWIKQLVEQNWDVHLFPVYDADPHEALTNVTIHSFCTARPANLNSSVHLKGLYPLRRGRYRVKQLAEDLLPERMARHAQLASLVRRLKPDIMHSLEMQRAGYLTLEAKNALHGKFPPWLVSSWGSDLYLFGCLAEHAPKIKAVLSACDYFTADCNRDIELARRFGFTGDSFPPLPVAGGFDLERLQSLRPPGHTSARRLIVLKGYQNWAGRALNGLRAIELCAHMLKGYRVVIYLANSDVALAAEWLTQKSGIPIEIMPKSSHEKTLQMFGSARISIGISISDGLPLSTLEAALMGAFPIQSNTSCIAERLRDGENVLLVPPDDTEAIAAAIQRALIDNELVDRAAALNFGIIAESLSDAVVQPQVIAIYRKIYAAHSAQHGM